jgi:hypothetical protein
MVLFAKVFGLVLIAFIAGVIVGDYHADREKENEQII